MSESFVKRPDTGSHSALTGLGVLKSERPAADPLDVLRRIVADQDDLKGLAAALRSQRQMDEDGTEVGVSRQAADEAATIIEALDRALGAQGTVKEAGNGMDPWRLAVDTALVDSGLDCTTDSDDPATRVDELLKWTATVALDPAVSAAAQALVGRGTSMADRYQRERTSGVKALHDNHPAVTVQDQHEFAGARVLPAGAHFTDDAGNLYDENAEPLPAGVKEDGRG